MEVLYRQARAAGHYRVQDAGETLDPVALDARIRSLAQRLAAIGVQAREAVLFVGDQGAGAFVAFWAAVLQGAVFAPLDPSRPVAYLRAVARRLDARVAVVDADLAGPLRAALPSLPILTTADLAVVDGSAPPWSPALEQPGDAPAVYLPTSGSTGEPKLVVIGRAALAHSARLLVQTFDWRPGERLLNLADPHTMSGLRNALVAAPAAGMSWSCLPRSRRPNLFALLDEIAALAPQVLVAAPMLLRQINLLGARAPVDELRRLRAVYCTGTDLNNDEVRRFHARFGVPVINYYGLTETVGLCLSQRLHEWSPQDASIGHPAGCEIRLVDDDGTPVAEGAAGELQVRQPWPMSGYLGDPQASAQCYDGPWLRTGDLARRLPDGRVVLCGRLADFINTPGTERIHPAEIEAACERLPAVAQAAVCGLPDAAGGERLAALIVPRADADPALLEPAHLGEQLRQALGPSRVPSVFRIVATLPRSANGKLLRRQLPALIDHAPDPAPSRP